MLPGPSASEVTTLWRYTNMFIITIIIIIIINSALSTEYFVCRVTVLIVATV